MIGARTPGLPTTEGWTIGGWKTGASMTGASTLGGWMAVAWTTRRLALLLPPRPRRAAMLSAAVLALLTGFGLVATVLVRRAS